MDQKQYFAVLHELKMDGMARYVASPKQFVTTTPKSFLINVMMLNGKPQSVWMSQNREVSGKILMEKEFIEFEGDGEKFHEREESHADMLKWIEWCEKEGVRAVVLGSGHKSLHGFMHIENQFMNGNDGRKYESIGKGLVEKLGLSTVDFRCCEPKRLHRVPLTKRSDQNTCIPIPLNMVSDLKSIIELEKDPFVKLGTYRTKGGEKKIDELVKLTGAGSSSSGSHSNPSLPYQPLNLPDDQLPRYLDSIMQQKCVVREMLTNAPIHDARVAYLSWLNFLGFSEAEALDLTDRLAEYANWEDKNNTSNRHYYVQHGIGRKYVPYSCERLQFKGVKCVGESCPMYKSVVVR